jgi:nucleotide-binding universal stress UspA family protein
VKTVLAPIDFSHASDCVIDSAIALARGLDARLVLLNVIPRTAISGGPVSLTLAAADLVAEAEKDSARRLSRLQRALYDDGVTVHVMQARGDPRQCIIDQAEELHANYVVMAAHGDRAFDPALIGSTTSGVLKHTSCSVVIVPTDGASDTKPPRRVRARTIARTRSATRAELVGV